MHSTFLDQIKAFEGFSARAKPDYAQHSNGFGTKALYPGEVIDSSEAERRFASEIAHARQFVERHAAHLDEGTKAALTSLTFNAGTRWAADGLGEAARVGDLQAVAERFVQYTKAGGKDLPGLVSRRLAEATWIGRPVENDATALKIIVAADIGSEGGRAALQLAQSTQQAGLSATDNSSNSAQVIAGLTQHQGEDKSSAMSVALGLSLLEALSLLTLATPLGADKDARQDDEATHPHEKAHASRTI